MIKEPHHANEQLSICVDAMARYYLSIEKILNLVKVQPLQVAAQ